VKKSVKRSPYIFNILKRISYVGVLGRLK